MVKFTAQDGKRTLIGLGISEGNVERLKQGHPIHINLESLNLPWSADVMIFYGDTEQSITDQVRPFIDEHTVIHKEKRQ